MDTILAKDFNSRDDLESHISIKYGLTADKKTTVQIQGTRDELANLHLTDQTTVWGISCVITDSPTTAPPVVAVDRGDIQTNFGINQATNRNPNI